MAGTFSQSYAPQFAGGIFEVTSQFVGQILVDSIRKQFPRQKTQRGDFYMDLTHHILDANLSLIKPNDKKSIRILFERVTQKRDELDSTEGDSRLQRSLKARKFKQLSKELYIITRRASDRGRNESLMSQMMQATGATELNNRNLFDDPPLGRAFTDSSTDTLESVEMSTFQSSTTGEGAVALTVHEQEGPTEEFVATFPPEVFANDRMDRGVQTFMVVEAEQDVLEPQETDLETDGR